ncbi:TetR/AcrR family transcriptional regulator [Prauserella cavernicola]|uniref:TetR family transcriptional regulator n=1 Tax=Prauserella cavernicola TaxID=2800127 RepID=A0A934QW02_9PSEU|nr:TetR family transcriptional regulator [Prauserella cavernicola]MBK1787428.1 TetR family transcriptional regulator [Prauserella cavernicola]
MPRASAAAAAATAQEILDRATTLFAERGFAAVSLDDVAHAAGVTRGAVYHHYGNKTGVFRAVAERLQATVASAVTGAATQPDAAGRLRAGSHAFVDAITTAPANRVLLVDGPAALGWAQWRRFDSENSVVHLREALAESGVASDLLDAMTAQLSGAMNEAALWLAERPGDADARQAAHRALDRLLDSVVD